MPAGVKLPASAPKWSVRLSNTNLDANLHSWFENQTHVAVAVQAIVADLPACRAIRGRTCAARLRGMALLMEPSSWGWGLSVGRASVETSHAGDTKLTATPGAVRTLSVLHDIPFDDVAVFNFTIPKLKPTKTFTRGVRGLRLVLWGTTFQTRKSLGAVGARGTTRALFNTSILDKLNSTTGSKEVVNTADQVGMSFKAFYAAKPSTSCLPGGACTTIRTLRLLVSNENRWPQDIPRPAYLRLSINANVSQGLLSGRNTLLVRPSSSFYFSWGSAPDITLLAVPKPGDTIKYSIKIAYTHPRIGPEAEALGFGSICAQATTPLQPPNSCKIWMLTGGGQEWISYLWGPTRGLNYTGR